MRTQRNSRRRNGFTMIEMIISLSIMSILLAIGMPRMFEMRDKGAIRSAKQQIASYLATARAAAIRRGRPAQFRAVSNKIWVTTTGVGGMDTVARLIKLDDAYAITLTAGVDSVVFDPRGFATNLAGTQKFKVQRNTYSDSVCIGRGGLISRQCSL